ncbi:hypothetical protein MNEG_13285 [Monoraphidium neglectum]|uniref:PPM-type phosphatase domain-containing protein n=1 Tax=Monoraphidium neglectum TaxID=145388 RepID=A0A0D2KFM1_9CHLO|nr:hypothetical protein MNEG_13285 [Monoraphidium neglectum]KIY94678.1 hypothetical protein MNEG_13285 [Monoraphidium neglectum]|eukprot:XP_013893698.1 hypothetical protein MNEG_13285 [Monoraphidium neglectum]
MRADAECKRRFRKSGTTATLAVACGWELVVASVGDSCAYLDTGREILLVSANHRIDENADERARILAAGGEIAPSSVEGVPAGPQRVWPGGLAMSRSIGDREAGDLVPAAPEVRQITLPTSGARLVIASDGVWDQGLSAKSVVGAVRRDNAAAAAHKIAMSALKRKGLRDDITVIVVDFLPAGSAPDAKWAPGGGASSEVRVQHYRPLETASTSWRGHLAARRAEAVELVRAAQRAAQSDEAHPQASPEGTEATAAAADGAADSAAADAGGAGSYHDLACLVVDVSDPAALLSEVQRQDREEEEERQRQAAAAAADEWTEVGAGKSRVNVEAELRAAAKRGGGRGARGRGSAAGARPSGRFGGRGGRGPRRDEDGAAASSSAGAEPEQQQEGLAAAPEQQQGVPLSAAVSPDGAQQPHPQSG